MLHILNNHIRNYSSCREVYINRECALEFSHDLSDIEVFIGNSRVACRPQHPRHKPPHWSSCTYRACCEAVAYPPPLIIWVWFREIRPRTCAPYVIVYGKTGTSRNRQGGSFNGVIVPLQRCRETDATLGIKHAPFTFLRCNGRTQKQKSPGTTYCLATSSLCYHSLSHLASRISHSSVCSLFGSTFTRTCTHVYPLAYTYTSFTDSSSSLFHMLFTCSLVLSCSRTSLVFFARSYTLLSLFILGVSSSRFFRHDSWYCRNQTFVPGDIRCER